MRAMAAVLAIGLSLGAAAADLTDTWHDPADPGWGLSLVQDRDTVTVGLFTYDGQGQPRWYSAALQRSAQGATEYGGPLFETTRTGADPRSAQVGEIRLHPLDDGRADVDYRIGTREHHARVERFAFTQDRLEGLFFTTLLPGYDACPQNFEALRVWEDALMQVDRCDGADCLNDPPQTRDRSPVHMVIADASREVCSIDGRFTRHGTSGAIVGTYECADGGNGAIEMRDIEFTSMGFHARFTAAHPQCREFRGILSGVRANAR